MLLLHTGHFTSPSAYTKTVSRITTLKSEHRNVALLHAGNAMPENPEQLKYDASLQHNSSNSLKPAAYRIMYKGSIKMGVLSAGSGENNSIEEINAIASYLKKQKNCDLVVCLSQLGYKNKNGVDDYTLASESTNLDLIIGGHAEKFSNHPMIVLNKNKEEVIINHSTGSELDLGKIEICFNDKRQKSFIAF